MIHCKYDRAHGLLVASLPFYPGTVNDLHLALSYLLNLELRYLFRSTYYHCHRGFSPVYDIIPICHLQECIRLGLR